MYQSLIYYFMSFTVGAICSNAIVPWICRFTNRYKIGIDLPDSRRLHTRPTPRCGGVAVFVGFHLAAFTVFHIPGFEALVGSLHQDWWRVFFVASSMLFMVGLYDDIRGISWSVKLASQVLVALFLFFNDISVDQVLNVNLPFALNLVCTLGWFIIIINAFNLIDGLDGLASGLAICSALGLACMAFYMRHPADAVVLMALVGACAGFLRHNFHPAKIFLGDSGSLFLGLTLATVALSTNHKATTTLALGVPLLALGIPIFDTMLAIWRRSTRAFICKLEGGGKLSSIVKADKDHLHHRLVAAGLTQKRVALQLYVANLALVAVGTLSLVLSNHRVGILAVALVVGIYVVVRTVTHVELLDSGMLIVKGLSKPSTQTLPSLLYPFIDFVTLNIALALSLKLVHPDVSFQDLKGVFFSSFPIWCVIAFVMLAAFKTYSRVWSRSRISDFIVLFSALLGGVVVSFGITMSGEEHDVLGPVLTYTQIVQAIIFFNFASMGILGVRLMPRILRDGLAIIFHTKIQDGDNKEHILIYGAGARSQLLLKDKMHSMGDQCVHSMRIIGYIDDNKHLRKRYIYGYKVLGHGAELKGIAKKHGVTHLIVACDLPASTRQELAEISEQCGFTLSEWRTFETINRRAKAKRPSISHIGNQLESANEERKVSVG